MSKGIVFCACVALLCSAAMVEAGQPSAAKMRQMGLYGVPVVSDAVAMEVRGMGYGGHRGGVVKVWGSSSAEVEYESHDVEAEASAENGYYAEGNNVAAGVTVSVATVLVPEKGGDKGGGGKGKDGGGGHLQPVAIAVGGGFSAAFAH